MDVAVPEPRCSARPMMPESVPVMLLALPAFVCPKTSSAVIPKPEDVKSHSACTVAALPKAVSVLFTLRSPTGAIADPCAVIGAPTVSRPSGLVVPMPMWSAEASRKKVVASKVTFLVSVKLPVESVTGTKAFEPPTAEVSRSSKRSELRA